MLPVRLWIIVLAGCLRSPCMAAFVPLKPGIRLSSTIFSSTKSTTERINTVNIASTKEERASKAKRTWSTVALQKNPRQEVRSISLLEDATGVTDKKAWRDFCTTIRGTYFINGLASCQLGDRILHPFEAHGLCKSLAFDGEGSLTFTVKLIETELNSQEADAQRILARGVMSTQHNYDNPLGAIRNAFSPTRRDTANLVANVWPLPTASSSLDPMVLTCTDNGVPHVLDPKTMTTRGKLIDVVPKLKPLFAGKEFLAHTRHDESRDRFIMCQSAMDIPGDDARQGNSTYHFMEFDSEFELVSSRSVTTRFMVAHE